MANPSRAWDLIPVYGVYLRIDEQPSPGSVTFSLNSRVTRVDGRVIYPDGAQVTVQIGNQTQQNSAIRSAVRAAWRAADLAANVGPRGGVFVGTEWDSWWDDVIVPAAIFTGFPASDDPNIVQTGYTATVREQLTSGGGKTYGIQPLLAQLDLTIPGINLGLIEVPPGSPAIPAPMYAKGVPGGVAGLDVDGDVVDSDGVKVGGGSVNAEDVRDVVAAALAEGANIDITVNDPADTITIAAVMPIDDAGAVGTAKLWSSTKTQAAIAAAVTGLINAAPGALDTLVELAAALGNDAAFSTTITTALSNRLRVDTAAQGLNTTQQANARANLGFVEAAQDAALGAVTGAAGITVNYDDVANVLTVDGSTLDSRISSLEAGGGGSGGSALGTEIMFSQMSGSTDDAKLAAAIALQQTPTLKGRVIVLNENRDYTFTAQITAPSGFAIRGALRVQDQPRSSRPVGNRVLLRMAGASSGKGWLKAGSGSTFGWSVSNLSIDADANSSMVAESETYSGVLWTASFRDISIQNAKSVFGNKTNTLLLTADAFDGWWNINNIREVGWKLGGSDFFSAPSIMLVDSPTDLIGWNEFLMVFSFLQNAWFSNVYCTAEGHAGVLIEGSNNSTNSAWLEKFVLEGRNANHPSLGALVRHNGGQAMIQNTRFAFAMGNPAMITSRSDKGAIHVASGDLVVQDSVYARGYTVTSWTPGGDPTLGPAVGVDVPFLYVASGAKARVRNIKAIGPATGDLAWGANKPICKEAVAGSIDADSSVTVVAVQTAAVLNGSSADRSSGFANTGTSLTINKPANLQDGVLLVAAVLGRNNTAAYTTPPTDWVEQAPTTDSTGPGVLRFYTKQLVGVGSAAAEPSSYTWAGGGSGRHVGEIIQVTGAPSSSPVDVKGAIATLINTPDRVIITGVTTLNDLDLLIGVAQSSSTGGVPMPFTAPTGGGTVIGSAQTSTGASESALTIWAQAAVAVGATGTRSTPTNPTSGASTGSGYMIAIKSAG